MRVTREWYTNARPRAVVLLSSEPRAANEKVEICLVSRARILPCFSVKKNMRLLAVYTDAHAEVLFSLTEPFVPFYCRHR